MEVLHCQANSQAHKVFREKKKYRLVVPGHDKAREKPSHVSLSGGKPTRCMVMPSNAAVVAETRERRNRTLFVRTKLANDLIVQVGEDCFHLHKQTTHQSKPENATETWWFEDVSRLRIDHFIEVPISKRNTDETGTSRIMHSLLDQITSRNTRLRSKVTTYKVQRITIKCLIRILPVDQNTVAFNFLLWLLKVAVMMEINSELNPASKTFAVGRLVDAYLALVAKGEKLKAKDFQSLAEALPQRSRYRNDNLHRAMDMFSKPHPNLTEEEETGLCKAMDYHKLSQEAREHMMKNVRLPLSFTTRASKHGKVDDCSRVQPLSNKIPGNNESYPGSRQSVLALPTIPGPLPKLQTDPSELENFRVRALSLLAVAGVSGFRQVSIPLGLHENLPEPVPR
ncbi:NPH3 domain [Dillenia turbinata]|uniref:NPH3 domain n=1 Tax=Dillenia turbinata TaxID=194707 RepID=A0AAN8UU70_9MAGN